MFQRVSRQGEKFELATFFKKDLDFPFKYKGIDKYRTVQIKICCFFLVKKVVRNRLPFSFLSY